MNHAFCGFARTNRDGSLAALDPRVIAMSICAWLLLQDVHSEMPAYDAIIPALLKAPIMELPTFCSVKPGLPMKPMLAEPTKASPRRRARCRTRSHRHCSRLSVRTGMRASAVLRPCWRTGRPHGERWSVRRSA